MASDDIDRHGVYAVRYTISSIYHYMLCILLPLHPSYSILYEQKMNKTEYLYANRTVYGPGDGLVYGMGDGLVYGGDGMEGAFLTDGIG